MFWLFSEGKIIFTWIQNIVEQRDNFFLSIAEKLQQIGELQLLQYL